MEKFRTKLAAALLAGVLCASSVTVSAASHLTFFLNRTYIAEGSCSSVGYDNSLYTCAKMIGYYVKSDVQTYTKVNVDGEGLQEVIAFYYESGINENIVSIEWNDSDGYLLTKTDFKYFYGLEKNDMVQVENGIITLEP